MWLGGIADWVVFVGARIAGASDTAAQAFEHSRGHDRVVGHD